MLKSTNQVIQRLLRPSIAICLLSVFATGCNGQREAVSKGDLPFIIKDAYVREWLGGAPGMGKGMEFALLLDQPLNRLRLDSVYYGRLAGVLEPKGSDSLLYIAALHPVKAGDLVMIEDSLKEAVNTPTTRRKDGTGNGRALLIYSYRGERHSKVVGNVRKEETIAYPQGPPGEKQ